MRAATPDLYGFCICVARHPYDRSDAKTLAVISYISTVFSSFHSACRSASLAANRQDSCLDIATILLDALRIPGSAVGMEQAEGLIRLLSCHPSVMAMDWKLADPGGPSLSLTQGPSLSLTRGPSLSLPPTLTSLAGFTAEEIAVAVTAAAEAAPGGGTTPAQFAASALTQLAARRCGERVAAEASQLADEDLSPILAGGSSPWEGQLGDLLGFTCADGSPFDRRSQRLSDQAAVQEAGFFTAASGLMGGRASLTTFASLGFGMDEDTGRGLSFDGGPPPDAPDEGRWLLGTVYEGAAVAAAGPQPLVATDTLAAPRPEFYGHDTADRDGEAPV